MNEKKPGKFNSLHKFLFDCDIYNDLRGGKTHIFETWTFFVFVITICAWAIFHKITTMRD